MLGLLYQSKIIHLKLDDNLYLSEFIFCPELSQLGTKKKNTQNLRSLIHSLAQDYNQLHLYQRQLPQDVELQTFEIELKAPKNSLENEDFPISLQGLKWEIPGNGKMCYFPVIGTQVVCTDKDKDFNEVIIKELNHALRRLRIAASYEKLEHLSRIKEIEIEENEMYLNLKSPVERLHDKETEKKSELKEACTDLEFVGVYRSYHCANDVKMLADLLNSSSSPSLILVGPAGVGKTAIFNEMVNRKQFYGLTGRRFYRTTGSRLVAGMTGFGQWQERCIKIIDELKKCRGILHVGNAIELLDAGKSVNNSQGIASFLETYVNRGDLTCVVECTPEEYSLIEKLQPGFLETFYKVTINEPEDDRLKLILRDVIRQKLNTGREYEEAIKTATSLMKRYSPYTAFPGKAIRLLDYVIKDTKSKDKGERFFESSDVYSHFSTQSGLPEFLIDEKKLLDAKTCNEFFEKKVAGQSPAVDTVVKTLLAVKSNLIRPMKPIASLLFVGPTGVGKTEMAKTLAEYLFNDRNRIIRFDMSEFATPTSILSLTGFGNRQEGLLTSKVRNQPFSVILFDELEKAGPGFFDLLLQILGEGRLTDHKGRTADFCSSVIIMTSNLGAAGFQSGSLGFQESGRSYEDAVEHFSSAVRKFFRPEIYNRIDRIVPFMPLELEVIKKICRKELELINEREGLRYRKVKFDISEELIEHLAVKGCDPLFGARPLKRTLEQELITPLSQELNQFSQEASLHVDAALEEKELKLTITDRNKEVVNDKKRNDSATILYSIITLRRKLALLGKSSLQRILNNKISELKYHIRSAENIKDKTLYEKEQHRFMTLRDDREIAYDELVLLEEETLIDFYKGKELNIPNLQNLRKEWEIKIREVFKRYFCVPFDVTDEAGVFIKSQSKRDLLILINSFRSLIGKEGKFKLHKVNIYDPPKKVKDEKTGKEELIPFEVEEISNAEAKLKKEDIVGLDYFLQLKSPYILPKLRGENGMTTFIKENDKQFGWVRVIEWDLKAFVPPEDLKEWEDRKRDTKRRTVEFHTHLVKDPIANKNLNSHGKYAETIAQIIDTLFEEESWQLLDTPEDKLQSAKRMLSLD